MPDFKSASVTLKFLEGLINGEIFSFKIPDVLYRQVVSSSTKDFLIFKIETAFKKKYPENKLPLGLDKYHPPNKKYLVMLLYNLDTSDALFHPDSAFSM